MQVSTTWRERIRSAKQKPDLQNGRSRSPAKSLPNLFLGQFPPPITKSSFSVSSVRAWQTYQGHRDLLIPLRMHISQRNQSSHRAHSSPLPRNQVADHASCVKTLPLIWVSFVCTIITSIEESDTTVSTGHEELSCRAYFANPGEPHKQATAFERKS